MTGFVSAQEERGKAPIPTGTQKVDHQLLDQLLPMGRPQLEEQRIEPVGWEAGDSDGLWWVLTSALSCPASPSLFSCEK